MLYCTTLYNIRFWLINRALWTAHKLLIVESRVYRLCFESEDLTKSNQTLRLCLVNGQKIADPEPNVVNEKKGDKGGKPGWQTEP